jgi:hypothetical protein
MQLLASGKYLFSNGQLTGYNAGGGGVESSAGSTLGKGLLTSGAKVTMAGGISQLAQFSSYNGGPVWDWLTHESPLGTIFQGVESIGDWWSRMLKEQQERTDTFGDNWNPDSENANVVAKFVGEIRDVYQNQIDYWEQIGDVLREAAKAQEEAEQRENEQPPKEKLNLDDYTDWVLGDEWSIEEIQAAMAERNGGKAVEVPTEPDVADDATEKIEEKIGTVTVPVNLVLAGGGSGMVPFPIEGFHANGLPFVPFDNYLALLHRGERVLPASQNRNYTYNSNNYFGNVNLNNGMQVEALCDSIDRHNRMAMRGFGE